MPDIRFHPISTLLLGLALLGLGCGDGNDGGSSTGVPIENMPTEYAAAYCSWLYRCCPSAQLAHLADAPLTFTGNSEMECRTNYQALVTLVLPTMTASQGAGRLRYNPQAAKACFDGLKSSCAAPEAVCATMVEPLVATGGACTQDGECQDRVCLGETSDADGICGSHLSLGEACEEASDCSAGACTGKCTEKAAIGAFCVADETCASGYCDYQASACATAPYSGACSPGS